MIIILSNKEDAHAQYVFETLKKRGIEVCYFDTRNYPTINWTLNDEKNYLVIDNKKIYVKDIEGLYWRWYYGVVHAGNDIIYREKTSALETFLLSIEDLCYNSLQAVELHRKKGVQTKIMYDNGIRTPRTAIVNIHEALEEFYFDNNQSIIYKPVRGGAYTQKFKEEDLLRTNSLKNCPCQLQEFIDGVDIRVYAFESGEVFAGEIIAENIDFRQDQNAVIKNLKLPESVEKDCLKVLKLLGLKYSGIDIRLSKNGEYVFIEGNPAPMFIHFERTTGYPITETLIKNLQKGR